LAAAGAAAFPAALDGARRKLAEATAPETTSLRLPKLAGSACFAPTDILDDPLREEGFADIRDVPGPPVSEPENIVRAV
jgi:hypothetical protein